MIVKTKLITVRVEVEDAFFMMRELSTEQMTDLAVSSEVSPGSGIVNTISIQVREWGNVEDDNGPIDCTLQNKTMVFSSNPNLSEKVLLQFAEKLKKVIEDEKKILQNGQPGTSTPEDSTATSAEG